MFTFEELVTLRKGLDVLATDKATDKEIEMITNLHYKIAQMQAAQNNRVSHTAAGKANAAPQ